MDDSLKKQTEDILGELGLNMTTAITMFAKAIVRERRLPLDLSVDPFYSAANQVRLKRSIEEYESSRFAQKDDGGVGEDVRECLIYCFFLMAGRIISIGRRRTRKSYGGSTP